jgi:hypothetical protein
MSLNASRAQKPAAKFFNIFPCPTRLRVSQAKRGRGSPCHKLFASRTRPCQPFLSAPVPAIDDGPHPGSGSGSANQKRARPLSTRRVTTTFYREIYSSTLPFTLQLSSGNLRRRIPSCKTLSGHGNTERILVHRNPAHCRLSLFSPGSPGREVIIRKNAERSPETPRVCRREYLRSYLAIFGQEKSGRIRFRAFGVFP